MTYGISFRLNGSPVTARSPPAATLLRVLREELGIRSVKPGCETGECGACTVLLDGVPVTSCTVLLSQVEGRDVTTLEGLSGDPLMGSLQEAFVEEGAVQCGYCTPGFLISAYAALSGRRNSGPSEREIAESLSGNLCRCGAYPRILRAVLRVSR
ncbi:MAG: (2Fe-2S)-binding protein [Nitrososphaeria archaeon]|jgi:carbon-monoxide dehydrogenase small subunit